MSIADDGAVVDVPDFGSVDAADVGDGPSDAEMDDLAPTDGGIGDGPTMDVEPGDAPNDGGPDAGSPEVGPSDTGSPDLGPLPPPSEWTWSRGANFPERFRPSVWGGDRIYLGAEDRPFMAASPGAMYWPEADTFVNLEIFPSIGQAVGGVSVWTGSLWLSAGGSDISAGAIDDFVAYDPGSDRFVNFGRLPGSLAAGLFLTFNNIAFLYGGVCSSAIPTSPNGCFRRGSVFDPATGIWTDISTVGSPQMPPNDDTSIPTGVWTGSEVLVWYGSGNPAGRYNPMTDSWAPLAQPSFTLDRGRAVWTGSEMFVWTDAAAGLYDPVANTWRPAAPVVGIANGVPVWVGAEVVVLGSGAGGHYDPIADSWTPANPQNYFGSYPTTALWTGDDIIVFTPSASYRYGPRQRGRLNCDGSGNADLSARIARPVARRTAVGTLPLQANVTNNFSIVRLQWLVDGTVVSNGVEDTSFDFSMLPIGPHTLTFEVEDARGNVACIDQAIDVGRAPTLTVTHPRPLDVASPTMTVEASCTDDTSCRVSLRRFNRTLAASGLAVGSHSETLDFSADEGGLVDVRWLATDSLGFTSGADRSILVRSNSALIRQDYIAGDICDVQGTRALSLEAGSYVLRDFSSGTSATFAAPAANEVHCRQSHLLPAGGAVLKAGATVSHYDGSVLSTWTAAATAQGGNYVASILNSNGPVTLRELVTGTSQSFGTSPYPNTLGVSANGTVVWENTSGSLYRRPLGGPDTLLATLAPPPSLPLVGISDDRAIWREGGGIAWTIKGLVNGSVATLTGPHNYPGGPKLDQTYGVAGTYLAFDAPDLTGVRQVWLVPPSGTPTLATGYADPTYFGGVIDSGAVIYERAGNQFHQSRLGTLTDLGVAGSVVAHAKDRFYVLHGRVLFLVAP